MIGAGEFLFFKWVFARAAGAGLFARRGFLPLPKTSIASHARRTPHVRGA
jgi:hypothetical protein